jgi:hypothetical protein
MLREADRRKGERIENFYCHFIDFVNSSRTFVFEFFDFISESC